MRGDDEIVLGRRREDGIVLGRAERLVIAAELGIDADEALMVADPADLPADLPFDIPVADLPVTGTVPALRAAGG